MTKWLTHLFLSKFYSCGWKNRKIHFEKKCLHIMIDRSEKKKNLGKNLLDSNSVPYEHQAMHLPLCPRWLDERKQTKYKFKCLKGELKKSNDGNLLKKKYLHTIINRFWNKKTKKKNYKKVIRASEEKLNNYDMCILILLGSGGSADWLSPSSVGLELGTCRTSVLSVNSGLRRRWEQTHKMQI